MSPTRVIVRQSPCHLARGGLNLILIKPFLTLMSIVILPEELMRHRFFLPAAATTVLVALLAVGSLSAPSLRAQEAAAPVEQADADGGVGRVYGDFAKLTLSDDQKKQIAQIQKEAKSQIARIESDAETKARAVLTDEQRKKLTDIDADRKEREKKAYEARKQKDKSDKEELARLRKEKQDRETGKNPQ